MSPTTVKDTMIAGAEGKENPSQSPIVVTSNGRGRSKRSTRNRPTASTTSTLPRKANKRCHRRSTISATSNPAPIANIVQPPTTLFTASAAVVSAEVRTLAMARRMAASTWSIACSRADHRLATKLEHDQGDQQHDPQPGGPRDVARQRRGRASRAAVPLARVDRGDGHAVSLHEAADAVMRRRRQDPLLSVGTASQRSIPTDRRRPLPATAGRVPGCPS